MVTMVLGIVSLAAVIFYCRKFLLVPYVQFAGTMLVYFICLSGIVYNIIHKAPMVGVD